MQSPAQLTQNLKDGAKYWVESQRQPQIDEKSVDSLLPSEMAADFLAANDSNPDSENHEFEYWPENAGIIKLWEKVSNSWEIDHWNGRFIGLKWTIIDAKLRIWERCGAEKITVDMIEGLEIMESEALYHLNKK